MNIPLTDNDYELADGHKGIWLTIKNLSVRITECDEGANVDIFALGREDEGAIASTWATYNEAAEDV